MDGGRIARNQKGIMKTKVKFKAVTDRGNVVTRVLEVEHPDFTEIDKTFSVKVNGVNTTLPFRRTVNEQVIEWLDDQDKSNLMYDNEWYCILNYEAHVPKPKVNKREAVFRLAEEAFTSEEAKASFVLVYSRLHKNLSKLSVEDQFKVVLDSFLLTAEGQAYTAGRMLAILQGKDPNEVKGYQLEETKNYLGLDC
jgi:hypothetical protein